MIETRWSCARVPILAATVAADVRCQDLLAVAWDKPQQLCHGG